MDTRSIQETIDKTIAEKFNTYRFADYKEHVIDCNWCVPSVLKASELLEKCHDYPD
jgi:hypothetical protein